MNHIIFELGLAVALIAVMGLLSAKFRLSIIPFYIIIGMLVGPHAPHLGIMDFRFIGSTATIVFLGQLGVIFLLFYLGLEFSLGQLMKAGKAIVTGGTIYIAINLAVGLLFGFFAGFPFKELILVAGITTISSSAITAKILVDLKRTANSETEMILGITMFEDIFLAVYISILSGLILGGGSSGAAIALSGSIALGYMLLLLLAGRKFVPFLNRALNIKSNEVFQLVIFSILFLVAGFSETIHVAESIGALLVGLILAETEHVKRIEHMILPYRDFFGAMFFFSFGLTIDPMSLGGTVGLSVAAVLVTVLGVVTSGMIAGRSSGLSPKASLNIGLTLLARGEFSIIVANLGKAGGLLAVIQPFAALYVLILAVLGPILAKESKAIFNGVSKLLPGKE